MTFEIIGPNGSGKSTILRQVALIVVLAQSGCFVPATYASIALYTTLMTRINSGMQSKRYVFFIYIFIYAMRKMCE